MEQRDNQCGENINESIIAQFCGDIVVDIQLLTQRYCHVSLGFNNQLLYRENSIVIITLSSHFDEQHFFFFGQIYIVIDLNETSNCFD